MRQIGKVIVRVESVVAIEFPHSAMQALRPRLQRHHNGAARRDPIIRLVVAVQSLELRQNVRRRHHIRFASAAPVVHFPAVDHPVVVAWARSFEADALVAGLRRHAVKRRDIRRNPCSHSRQRKHVSTVDTDVGQLLPGDQVADLVCLRLQVQRIGLHRHRGRTRAQYQTHVFTDRRRHVHDDSRLNVGLEPARRDLHVVAADVECRKVV